MNDNQFEYFEDIFQDINLLIDLIDSGKDEEAVEGLKELIGSIKDICEIDDENIID